MPGALDKSRPVVIPKTRASARSSTAPPPPGPPRPPPGQTRSPRRCRPPAPPSRPPRPPPPRPPPRSATPADPSYDRLICVWPWRAGGRPPWRTGCVPCQGRKPCLAGDFRLCHRLSGGGRLSAKGVIRLRMSSIPRPGSRHETELPVGPDTGRQPETSPDGRPLAAEVRGLVKTYGGLTAVAGIDFEIRRGEIFALLGPNGAGKTTTVEILEGYRARDGGQVTVLETVSMYAGLYPHPRPAGEVFDLVELTAKRDERVVRLSGGQQRRLDMAIALAGDPELLFLDEPTTGFDPSARREARDVVKNPAALGKTVLLTTHFMDEAQYLAASSGAAPEWPARRPDVGVGPPTAAGAAAKRSDPRDGMFRAGFSAVVAIRRGRDRITPADEGSNL